jgi:AcrR family transcriptional regulator
MDEIAEAADVSRMTVFNHFSRKEDLFFDLDEEGREDLLATLQKRKSGTASRGSLAAICIGRSPINDPTSASLKKAATSSWP